MSKKTVFLCKNGTFEDKKEIKVDDSIDDLLNQLSSKLNISAKTIFIEDGAEVKDVNFTRNKDKLFKSVGEDFIEPKVKVKFGDWITLNVGGKCFTTSKRTLTNSEPTSMLARMFSEDEDGFLFTPSSMDKNGAFLIDRSPTYFEPILNYLRCGQLVYDKHINPQGILEEARFFGIESIIPELEQTIKRECVQRDALPLSRRDVINALIKSPYTAELRFQGVNLAGADLSRLDLRYINFKYANMQGCNLTGSNLSWCCLERADLSHANLDCAHLLGN